MTKPSGLCLTQFLYMNDLIKTWFLDILLAQLKYFSIIAASNNATQGTKMYHKAAFAATLDDDLKTKMIEAFIDLTDSLSAHDFVDRYQPQHKTIIDGYASCKKRVYDVVIPMQFTGYTVDNFQANDVLMVINCLVDLLDSMSYHDFIDNVGSSNLTAEDIKAIRDAIY